MTNPTLRCRCCKGEVVICDIGGNFSRHPLYRLAHGTHSMGFSVCSPAKNAFREALDGAMAGLADLCQTAPVRAVEVAVIVPRPARRVLQFNQ